MKRASTIAALLILMTTSAVYAQSEYGPPAHTPLRPGQRVFTPADLKSLLERSQEASAIGNILKDAIKNPETLKSLGELSKALGNGASGAKLPIDLNNIDPSIKEAAQKLANDPKLREQFLKDPEIQKMAEQFKGKMPWLKDAIEGSQRDSNSGEGAGQADSTGMDRSDGRTPHFNNGDRGGRRNRNGAEGKQGDGSGGENSGRGRMNWDRFGRQGRDGQNRDGSAGPGPDGENGDADGANSSGNPLKDLQKRWKKMWGEEDENADGQGSAGIPGGGNRRGDNSPGNRNDGSGKSNSMQEHLRKGIESLRKMGGPIGNTLNESQALRDAARKDSAIRGPSDSSGMKFSIPKDTTLDFDRVKETLKGFGNSFESMRKWGDSANGSLRSKFPNLPKISPPSIKLSNKVSFPKFNFGVPHVPSFSRGGFGGGLSMPSGSTMMPMLWIIGIIVLVIVLLKYQPNISTVIQARLARRARPKSFDSERDKIRWLFEDAAVDQLGPNVESSNHREIVRQFESKTEHGAVAANFADLYEQARYTPVTEPLASDAVPLAERHSEALRQAPAKS